MPTPIGLDNLVFATITEDAAGIETYAAASISLAKSISAKLSIETNEAVQYADDGIDFDIKEFKDGKLTLKVNDIGASVASKLTGATVDQNGVLVSASEDSAPAVAVGFRAKKSNGKYRYFWLYRVVFSVPDTELNTKEDKISPATPTIEGTIMRRNKVDAGGKHPWKAQVDEDDTGVVAATITDWFKTVYEPVYNTTP